MSLLKTKSEIEKIAKGGKIMRRILSELREMAKPGVSTWELDQYAEKEIIKAGGRPSFKGYGMKGQEFPNALCTSVNDVIVHGAPSKKEILKDGDIIGLDIGMEYLGLYTDTAITVPIGKISDKAKMLLETTELALKKGIEQAKPGNRLGDIGAAVQAVADKRGLGVIRDLVGHGVGHAVHEDPHVPNYGKHGTGMVLKAGMVLAIEPMFSLGDYRLKSADDGMGIAMADGSLGAHFEHTVAITSRGPEILT